MCKQKSIPFPFHCNKLKWQHVLWSILYTSPVLNPALILLFKESVHLLWKASWERKTQSLEYEFDTVVGERFLFADIFSSAKQHRQIISMDDSFPTALYPKILAWRTLKSYANVYSLFINEIRVWQVSCPGGTTKIRYLTLYCVVLQSKDKV